MKRTIQALLTAVAVSFPFAGASQQPGTAPQSLRGAEATAADKVFEEHAWQGKMPGSQQPIPRTYSTQPPLIPHSIENLDEVTLEGNQCLSCHGLDAYKQAGAPRPGDRHFVGNDPKSGAIAGARHVCVTCHVPQADAQPLVGNQFRGDRIVTPAAAKKK